MEVLINVYRDKNLFLVGKSGTFVLTDLSLQTYMYSTCKSYELTCPIVGGSHREVCSHAHW